MRNDTNRITWLFHIISIVLVVALVVSAVFCAVYYGRSEPVSSIPSEPDFSEDIAKLEEEITLLEEKIEDYEGQIQGYQRLITDYEDRIMALLNDSASDDLIVTELRKQISILEEKSNALNSQIVAAKAEILSLTEQIESYDSLVVLDGQAKLDRLNSLMKILTENAPWRQLTKKVEYEITDPATGLPQVMTQEIAYEQYPNISFYYEDLTTGYVISYNSTEIRYAASLVKAPYIYCVLKEISDFYYRKHHYDAAGNLLYDENGNRLFEGTHPNYNEDGTLIFLEGEEKYDLSRSWTYDAETMYKEGSGVIKKEESGFQLTYRELIEHVILHSDNIALNVIREMFGTTAYTTEAKKIGVKGSSYGFMQLSAKDCSVWLKEMNLFMTENSVFMNETMTYGQWLKEMMLNAGFKILIQGGVSAEVAHKYGWDTNAFHDMGIVYDEHPYVLVIMTDLDEGSSAENNVVVKYFVSLVRAINQLHRSFYPVQTAQ